MMCSNDEKLQQNGCGEVDHGKIVLITGVSRGLGRALALELAKRGHTIVGCSRNQDKLDLLRTELLHVSPCNHLLLNLDVKSDGSVKEMAHIVTEKMGAPDIIVNNAALINKNCAMWEIPKEEFDDVVDTNIKGTANVLRHFIPLLILKNKGVVVNISSIYGRTGNPLVSAYCSSKWAIEGLSKSIAKEVPKGITMVALDPGVINTDMLGCHLGPSASQYQSPHQWALKGASIILSLTHADNGASITVDDLGIRPREKFEQLIK